MAIGTALILCKTVLSTVSTLSRTVGFTYSMDRQSAEDKKALEDYEVQYKHNDHYEGPKEKGRTASWNVYTHKQPTKLPAKSSTVPRAAYERLVEVEVSGLDPVKNEVQFLGRIQGLLGNGYLDTAHHLCQKKFQYFQLKVRHWNKNLSMHDMEKTFEASYIGRGPIS